MLSQLISDSGVTSGWLTVAALGVAVISYFLGCFNGSVVISRYVLMDDVRDHGSGNAGLTNFHRVFGGPLTLLVICADVMKAILSVIFGMYIASRLSLVLIPLGKYWAGLFCLLGHMYPATFGFRGGKGILSGGAMALIIDWRVALVVWGGFLILAVATRYISLGSCWAAASFPVASWFVYRDRLILILSLIMGGLILWRHQGNIVRLIRGTESKFTLNLKGVPGTAAAPQPKQPEPPRPEPAKQPEEAEKPAPAQQAAPEAGSAPEKPAPAQKQGQKQSQNKGKKGKSGKGRK